MRPLFLTLFALLLTIFSFVAAKGADEAEIQQLNEAYAAAVQQADGKALADLHSDDAVRATIAGVWVGRAAIEKGLVAQFETRPPGRTTKVTMNGIQMLTQDVAIVHGAYKSENGTGHFIRTLVKRDGAWKVAAIQVATDPSPSP